MMMNLLRIKNSLKATMAIKNTRQKQIGRVLFRAGWHRSRYYRSYVRI